MYKIPQRFQFKTAPVADPQSIVIQGNARFTVLTERCIRMEYAPQGGFEDRATATFLFREQPVVPFKTKRTNNVLTITTNALTLTYDFSSPVFTKESLSICIKGKPAVTWHYGDADTANLGGTFRTLDGRKGAVKLDPGLLSRNGWSLVNDSQTVIFDTNCWVAPRAAVPGQLDLYFFGYGSDSKACIRDFCRLSGEIPLIPRWALGNWWSRYWEYSHDDLMQLMGKFDEQKVPLSVCIIDMDWHITKNQYNDGWTGYTWNTELFPQPRQTLSNLHKKFGLKVGLNLHPHAGVHPHESAYEPMARFLGIDPKTKQPIPFDLPDPKFADAYFKFLHHPHEKDGVDFWWMDWQQGQKTSMEGLDPLVLLNHLHFHDLARDEKIRPFIFSRWHGLGNQRYQIGFSGDTIVCWESLAAQPHFTAASSNVAYPWWSHDIGGHFWGVEDPELYIRWVQYGVFSPILRMHSSKNRFQMRTPWDNGPEAGVVAAGALRLRHQLVPYLYSMAERTHTQSLPLVRPMYWEHPDSKEAYHCPRQYYFGTELIAAPFVTPRDHDTRLSRQAVWFPQGEWYQFFTGERIAGGTWHSVYGDIQEIPVFAKAGGIVPMNADSTANGVDNPAHIVLRMFAGADGEFDLYEDDGESERFAQGETCITKISQAFSPKGISVVINKPKGNLSLIPSKRTWTIELVGVTSECSVQGSCDKRALPLSSSYDQKRGVLTLVTPMLPSDSRITIGVKTTSADILDRKDRRAERLFWHLIHFKVNCNSTDAIYDALLTAGAKGVEKLRKAIPGLTPAQLRFVCEIFFDAGVEMLDDVIADEKSIILWNNSGKEIGYNLRSTFRQVTNGGPVEKFQCIPYALFDWSRMDSFIGEWGPWALHFDYAGLYQMRIGGEGHGPVCITA